MIKTKEFIEKNIKWIALFLCLVLVIGIAEDVLDNEIYKLDVIGYNFISKHIMSDNITPIVKVVTQFGGATFLIALATILLVAIKNKKTGCLIWINLVSSALLNKILKHKKLEK